MPRVAIGILYLQQAVRSVREVHTKLMFSADFVEPVKAALSAWPCPHLTVKRYDTDSICTTKLIYHEFDSFFHKVQLASSHTSRPLVAASTFSTRFKKHPLRMCYDRPVQDSAQIDRGPGQDIFLSLQGDYSSHFVVYSIERIVREFKLALQGHELSMFGGLHVVTAHHSSISQRLAFG